jgi:hypothetical protein
MHRPFLLCAAALAFALTGCSTTSTRMVESPNASKLDPKTQAKIKRGLIEPGFTPEMVYLALGKPSEPKDGLSDATQNGTWVYRDFQGNDRDLVRAGFRRRVVFDPQRRGDVVVTEPLDTKAFPQLQPRSLHVTFRDGRVVDIQRMPES